VTFTAAQVAIDETPPQHAIDEETPSCTVHKSCDSCTKAGCGWQISACQDNRFGGVCPVMDVRCSTSPSSCPQPISLSPKIGEECLVSKSKCPVGSICFKPSMSSMISFGGRRLFGAHATKATCTAYLTNDQPCSRGKTEFDVGVFKQKLCPPGRTCSKATRSVSSGGLIKTTLNVAPVAPVRGRRAQMQMRRAPNHYCESTKEQQPITCDPTEGPFQGPCPEARCMQAPAGCKPAKLFASSGSAQKQVCCPKMCYFVDDQGKQCGSA